MNFKIFYYLFLILPITQLIFFQIKKLNVGDANDCLVKFKSNNFLGLMIFLNIIIEKII